MCEKMKLPTIKWINHFQRHADAARLSSKDSTQVGAALFGPSNEVLLTSFNGPPIGVHDLESRRVRPTKYLYASHAEANLIAFCAKRGIQTSGLGVYVTHLPCSGCTKTLIQAGIKLVIVGPDSTYVSQTDIDVNASLSMFMEAGVTLVSLERDADGNSKIIEMA